MTKRLTVILRRGIVGTVQWTHKTQAEAFKRACALADLHMTALQMHGEDAYVIDASDYYSKASI